MLVIGKNPILELLKSEPKEISKIILLKTLNPEDRLKEIVHLAEMNKINMMYLNYNDFKKYFVSKKKSEGLSQGVIAFIKDFEYIPLRTMLMNIKNVVNPLVLLLDEITDPHNFGAIIRSAVCLGADGIIIPKHNSAEVNHTVYKTSSGAAKYIPIARETNLKNSIEILKKNGFWIVGADMNTNKLIYETDFKIPTGLVIGSEGFGMRKTIKDKCDILVRIPMGGRVSSLNASVSTAIFLYEIFRQKNV